jgi:hypothetical protein
MDPARQVDTIDDVVAAVVKWSAAFLEQPHEIVGGLPICPFARAARLKETIRFEALFRYGRSAGYTVKFSRLSESSLSKRRATHSKHCLSSTQIPHCVDQTLKPSSDG